MNTDLQFNIDDFYETRDHRRATLTIAGGIDGEAVKLEIVNDNGESAGHYKSWRDIADGNEQNLIFTNGEITIFDNCITSRCSYILELLFSYHDKSYTVSLIIDTADKGLIQ